MDPLFSPFLLSYRPKVLHVVLPAVETLCGRLKKNDDNKELKKKQDRRKEKERKIHKAKKKNGRLLSYRLPRYDSRLNWLYYLKKKNLEEKDFFSCLDSRDATITACLPWRGACVHRTPAVRYIHTYTYIRSRDISSLYGAL